MYAYSHSRSGQEEQGRWILINQTAVMKSKLTEWIGKAVQDQEINLLNLSRMNLSRIEKTVGLVRLFRIRR